PGALTKLQHLVASRLRVAVVAAFVDDIDRLPRAQTARVDDEAIVRRIVRVDRPVEAMGVADPVRPDLLAGARRRDERVVVRDPIAAVLADRTRRRMVVQIGNDAQDLPPQLLNPLPLPSPLPF